jgi:peptidoglycan/xylan/chitin deacetylase (PgdA/CDA1 family)
MLFLIAALGAAVVAHFAPFPFLLDGTDDTVWSMPRSGTPTVYLTFDDGPNPSATPELLDVLGRYNAKATFFVNHRHVTRETAPIVRRAFDEGHAVAIRWPSRDLMFRRPSFVASTLQEAAARLELLTGYQACRAFRPHRGGRSVPMLVGAADAGYTVVGWSWTLPEFDWSRVSSADQVASRLADRASAGDIILMRDGHPTDPQPDRSDDIETASHFIPALQARGMQFGTICP